MIKIKRITLSGFRGILTKQSLDLTNGGGKPTSLAVYGLNSSGKTSFVDGLEWFLSPNNEIEWLKRENAGCHSYPHQEAQGGNTFVDIEFSDSNYGDLTKTFNHQRITKPNLSQEDKFLELYQEFTIRPYLRYLEIIDFVFNRTGVEKYQKLANWMGFEEELAFQEKLALEIMPKLKGKEQELIIQNGYVNDEIKKLTELIDIEDNSLVNFCNDLLKQVNVSRIKNLDDLSEKIKELDKKKTGGNESKIAIITKALTNLRVFKVNSELTEKLKKLEGDINDFNKKKELVDKIDYISLFEKAYLVLNNQTEDDTTCPVCNTSWKRNQLLEHIKQELESLKEIKDTHNNILQEIEQVKTYIKNENDAIAPLQTSLQSIKDIGIDLEFSKLTLYKISLDDIYKSFEGSTFEADINAGGIEDLQKNLTHDLIILIDRLKKESDLLQLSKKEALINDVTEKIRLLGDKITRKNEVLEKQKFYESEIGKVADIFNEFFRLVEKNITTRFKEISSTIDQYFKILRQDKDIKDIEITLNLDTARAVGRSAEIQLSYYNLMVKPAYKVLSESLLNSLGLAVYFTCVKKFNINSKFIILDDVMNSLDVGHRDTLLDLIQQEFSDFQVILFTHDMHWFEKIQRRFPDWQHKKIKSWNYITGPKIDYAKSSIEEIKELLQDSTKADEAGRNFGIYVENILNELCEKLQAELRYRYTKHDPPATDELFIALKNRLKDKLNNNQVVTIVDNAYKFEPLIRNATCHSRQNYCSQISPQEVQRALDEWIKLEDALWCKTCRRFVEYYKDRDQIECRCGNMKLVRTN